MSLRRPRYLGDSHRRVQFYLTVEQADLLNALAEASGQSFPGVVRDLLTRHLKG